MSEISTVSNQETVARAIAARLAAAFGKLVTVETWLGDDRAAFQSLLRTAPLLLVTPVDLSWKGLDPEAQLGRFSWNYIVICSDRPVGMNNSDVQGSGPRGMGLLAMRENAALLLSGWVATLADGRNCDAAVVNGFPAITFDAMNGQPEVQVQAVSVTIISPAVAGIGPER
jgi:hypothetical protein